MGIFSHFLTLFLLYHLKTYVSIHNFDLFFKYIAVIIQNPKKHGVISVKKGI